MATFKCDPPVVLEQTAWMTAGARPLVERGIRLVGADYLPVAPFDDPTPTDVAVLEAGVVIVVGLDLRGVESGAHELICVPLLIPGSDGAPAGPETQRRRTSIGRIRASDPERQKAREGARRRARPLAVTIAALPGIPA